MYNIGTETPENYESTGRNIIKRFFKEKRFKGIRSVEVINESYKYSTTDVQIIFNCESGTTTAVGELKIRTNDIMYGDCILEEQKYNSLCNSSLIEKLYIVIYPKLDTIAIWNINQINNIEDYKSTLRCNKMTCTSRTNKITKDVYKLPLKIAHKYHFIMQ